MTNPSHASRIATIVVLAVAIAACGKPAARNPQQALGSLPDALDPPAASSATTAVPAASAAVAPTPTDVVAIDAPRLDVSSGEALAESLRRMDPTLSAPDRKWLRATMTIYTIRLNDRVAAIAQTYPPDHPPQFSDQQLLQMAYGELNGKTGSQIIALGRKAGQGISPDMLKALNAMPDPSPNGAASPVPTGF